MEVLVLGFHETCFKRKTKLKVMNRDAFVILSPNVQEAPEMIPASVSPVLGHSAPVCSQCVYNGETFLGGGWCNGDCS